MAVDVFTPRDFVVEFLPQTGSEFSVWFHRPGSFFSFEVDFSCVYTSESSSMSETHTVLVASQAGKGGILTHVSFGFKDSASSLCEQVRE